MGLNSLLVTIILTVLVADIASLDAGSRLAAAQKVLRARVFVFTAPSEFVDVESKRRSDSVQDIRKQLREKKTVTVAESADAADITIEVLGSEPVNTQELQTDTHRNVFTGGVSSRTRPVYLKQLMVTLAVRGTSYTTTFGSREREGYLQGWGILAKGVATQVDDWIKKNRSQLERRAADTLSDTRTGNAVR
jgi:hypothetical protein